MAARADGCVTVWSVRLGGSIGGARPGGSRLGGSRLGGGTLDVRFTAPGGVTVLFGRSGAGKSSVLNAVAGLVTPSECAISLHDRVLCDTGRDVFVPPERRRVAVVFQQPNLFRHLSAGGNLRFAARRAVSPPALGRAALLDILGIGGLLDRRVHTLSGGEAQRVAIGRAVLSAPIALLMDEPLAALDQERKAEILPMIVAVAQLGIPVLYVTHAMEEVARIADTLVLLRDLRVVAAGPFAAMTARADLPLAERDDAAAVLDGTVTSADGMLSVVRAAGRDFVVSGVLRVGPVRLRVFARDVILATARPVGVSVHNVLAGAVRAVRVTGTRALIEIALDGGEGDRAGPQGDPAGPQGGALLARVTPDVIGTLGLAPGTPVYALIKATAVGVLQFERGPRTHPLITR